MLDAPDLDFHDVLAAVERWRPDPQCLAAGDEYLRLAIRCWAGSLSDAQISRRVLDLVAAETDTPDIGRYDAAIAVARHAAFYGLSARNIVAILARLGRDLTDGPDPDEIAEIAQAAFAEFQA